MRYDAYSLHHYQSPSRVPSTDVQLVHSDTYLQHVLLGRRAHAHSHAADESITPTGAGGGAGHRVGMRRSGA
jgi:hypothetical protein